MNTEYVQDKKIQFTRYHIRWLLIMAGTVIALFVAMSYVASEYQPLIVSWVSIDTSFAMMVYVIFTALAIIIAPISTLPLIPVASIAFGWVVASVLYIFGLTIGSYGAFLIARYLGASVFSRIFSSNTIYILENRVPQKARFWTVILLRLLVPVPVLSYGLGLFSRISHISFILTTVIGVIPFSFLFSYVGTISIAYQLIIFFEVFLVLFVTHYFYVGTYTSHHIKKLVLVLAILILTILGIIFRDHILLFFTIAREITGNNPFAIAGILIALKTISAPLGFPGTPLTLLSGTLLGSYWGTLVAIIGNTSGAILAFLLARYILQDYVQNTLLSKYPKIKRFEDRIKEKGFSTVAALRLMPLFPFNGLNFLLGVTKISLKDYSLGSFIGMIPGTFAYVFLAGSIATFSPINILLASIGIVALLLIGNMYGKKF